MSIARRSVQSADFSLPRSGGRRAALIAFGVAIALLAAVLLLGGGARAWWARRAAARQLRAGAVSSAQDWLAWSAEFRPEDGRADLLRAACFRALRQGDAFLGALRSAEENGAPPELIQREAKLAQISSGELPQDPETQLAAMIRAGASPHDVCTAFVYGFLYRKEPERAKKVLDAWGTDFPDDTAVAYMRGVYQRALGGHALAQEELQAVLKEHPRHEPARIALAEVLEERGHFERALAHRLRLADSRSSDDTARLSVARLLRKTGRIDEARTLAATLASADEASEDALRELGEIALEQGDYQQARRLFQKLHSKPAHAHESVFTTAATLSLQGDSEEAEALLAEVTTSATAISLAGDVDEADRLFEQFNVFVGWIQRLQHLRTMLAVNPNDQSAMRELQALTSGPFSRATHGNAVGRVEENGSPQSAESGPGLYSRHCAVCHGVDGRGDGPAARHLYPRPKDLRTGNYRLIRTLSRVPTLEDVEAVVERGMPGASMPAFDDLSPSQRVLVAEEVLRLYREGIREQVVTWLSEEDEEIDEEEIRQTVEELTTPGEVVEPPEIAAPTPEAVARGRQLYGRLGCFHCHGDDGKGTADVPLTDDEGLPTSARDLTKEPFKGGAEAESVYLRVLLGMPGTPHPACPSLAQEELIDLVQFCRSLPGEPLQPLTNYQRMIRATRGQAPDVSDPP
jgi:tetratricopeptide (TPR) repeat protein